MLNNSLFRENTKDKKLVLRIALIFKLKMSTNLRRDLKIVIYFLILNSYFFIIHNFQF